MALRWRKTPRETGLAAVTQGLRGYELRDGGEDVGRVYPLKTRPWDYTASGWYWAACGKNSYTTKEIYNTPEEAKAACMAYVKEHYKKEV